MIRVELFTSLPASMSTSKHIKEQRDRFLAFSFASADMLIEVDAKGQIAGVFGAAHGMTGHGEIYWEEKSWLALFAEEEAEQLTELHQTAKPGMRWGPLPVALRDKPADKKAVLGGIKMPGTEHFYITLAASHADRMRPDFFSPGEDEPGEFERTQAKADQTYEFDRTDSKKKEIGEFGRTEALQEGEAGEFERTQGIAEAQAGEFERTNATGEGTDKGYDFGRTEALGQDGQTEFERTQALAADEAGEFERTQATEGQKGIPEFERTQTRDKNKGGPEFEATQTAEKHTGDTPEFERTQATQTPGKSAPEFERTQTAANSDKNAPEFERTQAAVKSDAPLPEFEATQKAEKSTKGIPEFERTETIEKESAPAPEFEATRTAGKQNKEIPEFERTQAAEKHAQPVPEFERTEAVETPGKPAPEFERTKEKEQEVPRIILQEARKPFEKNAAIPAALLDRTNFDRAIRAALESAKASQTEIAATFFDITPGEGAPYKMTDDAWSALAKATQEAILSAVHEGYIAAEITKGRYALLHAAEFDTQGLGDMISSVAASIKPEAKDMAVHIHTLPGDMKDISAKEALRGLMYTLEQFRQKGSEVKIVSIGDGLKACKSDNNEKKKIFQGMIQRMQFQLHFQPIVNLKTLEAKHFEMLSRFDNGEAADWITFGEDVGMAPDFDLTVCERAINYITFKAGGTTMKFCINLSGQSLQSPVFREKLLEMLLKGKRLEGRIIFEVSESPHIKNLREINDFIVLLQSHGFEAALEDFGATSTSLEYLQKLQVNYVKIDERYIRDIQDSEEARDTLQKLIKICKDQHKTVIAEWVETEEQYDILKDMGVDYGQGYLFGKPKHKPDFELKTSLKYRS